MITADATGIGNIGRRLALAARNVPQVFDQAAKSIARASGTEARREITQVFGIKQSRVAEGINVVASGFAVTTIASPKGITLQSFGGRQVKKGYSAAVRKGRRTLIAGGFTPPKFAGVPFKRDSESRFPISVLYGPSVAAMLRDPEVSSRFVLRQSTRAREELTRRLLRELRAK